ncbi:MAG: hypothetical protein ABI426_00940 [Flavobacterium sp.]
MGKLKGIIQITGKIDGLSFYEVGGKIVVRKTGGFDGKAIKEQDKYVRTRENATEFGHCATVGKQLRRALFWYAKKMNMPYLHSRVGGLMTQIMKCDTESSRGERTVAQGLLSAPGKDLLKGFEFHNTMTLWNMIRLSYDVLLEEGKVVFKDFDMRSILFPVGATHLSLQFLQLRFDFSNGHYLLEKGDVVRIAASDSRDDLVLTAPFIPATSDLNGVLLGLVFGEFLQEVNGENYGLEGCVLRVVGCG